MAPLALTNPRTKAEFALDESLLGALGVLSEDADGPFVALTTLSEHLYDDGALDADAARALTDEIARAMAAFDALGFLPDGSSPIDEVFESREARARRTFRRTFDPGALKHAVEPFATFVRACADAHDPIAWRGLG